MATVTTPPDVTPPPAGRPATAPKPRRVGGTRFRLTPYLLLIPALVLELAVHVLPILAGIWMSTRGLTQFFVRNWSEAPFVGLGNYRIVLDLDGPAGRDLLHSLVVTTFYTVLSVGLAWLLGMTAAVLLQKDFRGRGLLRTLFLTPYALPAYAAIITWTFLLQRDTGLLNHVLVDQLGVTQDRPFWLIGGNSFWSLVVVSVWRTWPFALLCLTAGLQTVPGELYEAASIDGAGFWRQLRSITLPMLRPVNQVLILVLFLWTFNDFNTPYVLFGRSAPYEADLISVHIYQASFTTWNFGLGSAMSVLLLAFLLVVTGTYLVLTRRWRSDD
ncbi:MAG: ABC transporter, permease protein 1 (cluster 1, maltose/g3p/polyamine/iron) [uncultured Corynebacteriales bacterium]|uniref:ABC transporter, permease protein 1 (Cluster 1, maltose/g3p/polyamine/iron) n=1 Tax=uncultured Mycobacteriales bacterium TaxID=581187 RepID=A0A6J4I7R3_9ACTN|nr:MAG: ABC transporter, permease protein 1 (cluster 1, maltose/g3p/polyamine/iron) [uncultured Corynebacteriales bacterium]